MFLPSKSFNKVIFGPAGINSKNLNLTNFAFFYKIICLLIRTDHHAAGTVSYIWTCLIHSDTSILNGGGCHNSRSWGAVTTRKTSTHFNSIGFTNP